jgi:DNA-binding HxlR family transcriptional regulator
MPTSKANLFLHPIRLRIITAISTQRMTAKQIAQSMPDIPLTTLYRNINALAEGGIIQVVEENQVRGTVEHVYALTGIPSLTDEDLRGMSKTDCEQAFTTYLSTLMSDARRYLDGKPDGEEIHLIQDGVVVSRIELFLSQEENRAMNERIQQIILEAGQNEPDHLRKRHVVTYVVIPFDS